MFEISTIPQDRGFSLVSFHYAAQDIRLLMKQACVRTHNYYLNGK